MAWKMTGWFREWLGGSENRLGVAEGDAGP